jgi:hypothetical protein
VPKSADFGRSAGVQIVPKPAGCGGIICLFCKIDGKTVNFPFRGESFGCDS